MTCRPCYSSALTETLHYTLQQCRVVMYFHIRAFRHIRSVLSDDMAKSVAVSLVSSRLDYANSLLFVTSASNLHKLQRVQNTLAKIVLNNSAITSATAMSLNDFAKSSDLRCAISVR